MKIIIKILGSEEIIQHSKFHIAECSPREKNTTKIYSGKLIIEQLIKHI